jgi:hypothetical protein
MAGMFLRTAMNPERESLDPENFILWQSSSTEPLVGRVAIAGDFVPPHNRAITSADDWREMAHPLDPLFRDVNATFANLEYPLSVDEIVPAHSKKNVAPCP